MRVKLNCTPLLLAALALAMAAMAQDAHTVQGQCDAVAKLLAKGDIEQIEILRLPAGYRNPVSVQPEDIERLWHRRLTIRRLLPTVGASLGTALRSATVRPSGRHSDLRWAFLFYSTSGKRVVGLYFDEHGGHGSIDQISVQYPDGLLTRLINSISLSIE